jgi:hypothetical protein
VSRNVLVDFSPCSLSSWRSFDRLVVWLLLLLGKLISISISISISVFRILLSLALALSSSFSRSDFLWPRIHTPVRRLPLRLPTSLFCSLARYLLLRPLRPRPLLRGTIVVPHPHPPRHRYPSLGTIDTHSTVSSRTNREFCRGSRGSWLLGGLISVRSTFSWPTWFSFWDGR